ncbi:MAG TPA: redoxin domain-containing protein [Opitutaceae bacterium]|nr:redoxin domain-containing protein [Opitutaceae bacterium]
MKTLLCSALLSAAIGVLSTPGLLAQTAETVPATKAGRAAGPKVGEMAPDFTVFDAAGKPVKLSDFRGKVVLVDIWATWCGPCVASMPHNSELATKHAKDDLVILAVCADDTRANYDSWIKRNGNKYAFRTAFDAPGKENWEKSIFATAYGVTGFPTLFLIDREGKLVGSASGGGNGENPAVTRLLAKGGIPVATAHLPPEDKSGPKSVPMMGKTMAMAAPAGAGMGGAMAPAFSIPTRRFGSIQPGNAVPDFKMLDMDGKEVALSSFKGKPLLIAFWTGARKPAADVEQLYQTYRDQGLQVIGLSSATERDDFVAWYRQNTSSLAHPVFSDPAGKAAMENISYMTFGIGMYPAYAMIDAQGRMVGGTIGMGPKVSGWLRELVQAVGLKPTEADKAVIDSTLKEAMQAHLDKAASAPKAAAPAPESTLLKVGAVAPDFAMKTADGADLRLSDFKGKVVVLDFWATWCGPCISSFPHTQKIAAQYKDQDVVILAAGTSDTIANFQRWIPKNQPKYPDMRFAFDPHERGSATEAERASAKLYGVSAIPTQFVIGRDGKVVAAIVGNNGADDARTETALAEAGVKVDPAIVATGREQLKKAAEDARAREEAAKIPTPSFRESFGRLKAGDALPDVDVQDPSGEIRKLSSYLEGKSAVIGFWSASMGPPAPMFQVWETWSAAYRDQNVVFIGIAGFGGRADFDAWREKNAGKFTFPVVLDPAGQPPKPEKDLADLTDEERGAFAAQQREHMGKVIPMQFGGVIPFLPSIVVVDSQGKFQGSSGGYGPKSEEAIGNLLLRSGVKLTAAHQPERVWTAAETKEAPPEPRKSMLAIGARAPDFETTTLDGKAIRLADFKGKVVILDFWATWCGPCMTAMPHTQKVAAEYKDQGVVVLGSCTSDTRAAFERWVKTNQEKYPDIIWSHDKAERGATRASHAQYGVSGIPTQFIIDREGKVVDIVIGYRDGERILDASLAKAGVNVAPDIIAKAAADLKRRAVLAGEPPAPALKLSPSPAKP